MNNMQINQTKSIYVSSLDLGLFWKPFMFDNNILDGLKTNCDSTHQKGPLGSEVQNWIFYIFLNGCSSSSILVHNFLKTDIMFSIMVISLMTVWWKSQFWEIWILTNYRGKKQFKSLFVLQSRVIGTEQDRYKHWKGGHWDP